ncbi:hypothetical protein BSL78_25970 [Apostichopus japonicus]|uniref:Glyoxylate reductase/hydroxypyruvate reductase n=1 Tax=Stichopus japonicus TaxID=307972 RepID=A0A2G8JN52_STIJA|nr:hypothetical protein BSL78_25970 [Apostichopus japonicus]
MRRCSIRQWDSDSPVPRDELLKNVAGADGLFCLLTDKIDKAVLDQAGSGLKVVSTMSVGYNHIDIKECQKRNIPVGFTPDVLTDATAELTIALLLMTSRRLLEAAEQVKSGGWGSWVPLWMCGPGLSGSTIGILGLGRIGAAIGERLLSFRVSKILYSSRSPKEETAAKLGAEFVSFDKLLKESDFLIVSCALTNETRHIFNAQTFKMMKKSAILINTSRGDVIKQDDLYSALVHGEIAAAGLDVTTPEPLPTDDPLLTLSNCVVLPHVGSATVETRTSMAVLAANNLLAGLNNQPLVAQVEVS